MGFFLITNYTNLLFLGFLNKLGFFLKLEKKVFIFVNLIFFYLKLILPLLKILFICLI